GSPASRRRAPLRGAGTRRPSFGLGIRRVHHPPLASRRRMLKAQSRRSDLSVQELKYSSIQETGDRPAALALLCFLASRVLELRAALPGGPQEKRKNQLIYPFRAIRKHQFGR